MFRHWGDEVSITPELTTPQFSSQLGKSFEKRFDAG